MSEDYARVAGVLTLENRDTEERRQLRRVRDGDGTTVLLS
jgi:hypothetical protein